jgi:hypothetical protein
MIHLKWRSSASAKQAKGRGRTSTVASEGRRVVHSRKRICCCSAELSLFADPSVGCMRLGPFFSKLLFHSLLFNHSYSTPLVHSINGAYSILTRGRPLISVAARSLLTADSLLLLSCRLHCHVAVPLHTTGSAGYPCNSNRKGEEEHGSEQGDTQMDSVGVETPWLLHSSVNQIRQLEFDLSLLSSALISNITTRIEGGWG